MHAATHPAESGSLRPYLFASILSHAALIALAPFVIATSLPHPVASEDDDGGGTWDPPPTEQTPPEPETAAVEPTPPPPEDVPDPAVDFTEVTPPPVSTPAPSIAPRVTAPKRSNATAQRTGPPNGRPGPPNPAARGPGAGGSGVSSPKPAYPYAARKLRLTGSGTVSAWTDASGRVVRCEVSGLPGMLTEFTRAFVQDQWRGPANAKFTRQIEYRLE